MGFFPLIVENDTYGWDRSCTTYLFNVSKLIDLHDIELLTSKRVETDNDYEIEYRKWLQDELTKQPSPSKDKRFFPVK